MTRSPRTEPRRRTSTLRWLVAALIAVSLALPATADAQRKKRGKRTRAKQDDKASTQPKNKKTQVFDFTGLELGGRLRTPQLLYFLDRAEQELDRAALEKRSFIPEMARSMEEEAL